MPYALTGPMIQESIKLHSAASWVELWEVRVDATRGYFYCAHPTSITFNGVTYSPFVVERGDEEEESNGNIPELQMTVANIDRAIQAEIEAGNLRGKVVIKRLVNTAILGTATNKKEYRYTILSADCTDIGAVFRLGPANPVNREFPSRRYNRNRCDLEYGGSLCGYLTTRSGALATCDRTYLASNGCKVHGDDEVAAGMPREHTNNYGGAPAIPRGPFL